MASIKVSVIVPVYNAEKYLKQCIESILGQTLLEIEVILVDDGSSDSSLNICEGYKQRDKRVQVIHQVNQGVSCARNVGLKIAKGEFIAFVDSDDWIDEKMYEMMYQIAQQNAAEVAICNYIEEWPKKKVLKEHYIQESVLDEKVEKDKFILNLLAGEGLNDPNNIMGFRGSCFYLYKRAKLKKQWFQENLPIGEDFVFNLNVLSNTHSIAVTKEAYYHYRMNEKSAMKRYRKDCYEEHKGLIQAVEQALNQYGLKEQAKEKLEVMKITYLVTRVSNECHKKNKKSFKRKIKLIKVMCEEESVQKLFLQLNEKTLTLRRKIWIRMYKNKCAKILYIYYRLKQ